MRLKVFKGAVFGAVGPRSGAKFTVIGPDGRKRVPSRYAHLVFWGSRNQPGNRFLTRALNQNKAKALRIQADGIKMNVLKEAAKK